MAIEAKVATVISDNEIAVNVGAAAGVREDDIAVVQRSTEVTDPVTNARLGTVKRPAIRMRVVEVHERLAVARVVEPARTIFALFDTALGATPRPALQRITTDPAGEGPDIVLVQRGFDVVIEARVPNASVESARPDDGAEEAAGARS